MARREFFRLAGRAILGIAADRTRRYSAQKPAGARRAGDQEREASRCTQVPRKVSVSPFSIVVAIRSASFVLDGPEDHRV